MFLQEYLHALPFERGQELEGKAGRARLLRLADQFYDIHRLFGISLRISSSLRLRRRA